MILGQRVAAEHAAEAVDLGARNRVDQTDGEVTRRPQVGVPDLLAARQQQIGQPTPDVATQGLVAIAHLRVDADAIEHGEQQAGALSVELDDGCDEHLDDLRNARPFPIRRVQSLLHRRVGVVAGALVQGVKQGVLVLEPGVEGADRGLRLPHDLRDGDLVESPRHQQLLGGVQQAVEGLLAAPLARRVDPADQRVGGLRRLCGHGVSAL